MIFGTRKVCVTPNLLILSLQLYVHIPHEYVLLTFTFDALLSHL